MKKSKVLALAATCLTLSSFMEPAVAGRRDANESRDIAYSLAKESLSQSQSTRLLAYRAIVEVIDANQIQSRADLSAKLIKDAAFRSEMGALGSRFKIARLETLSNSSGDSAEEETDGLAADEDDNVE